jgi:hypothetical protein
MIFFFSAKIGPKNSKSGVLNSQRRYNDDKLYHIRIQSLSFKTVPLDSSDSGEFSLGTSKFLPSQKNGIEMSTNLSTNRSTSSQSSSSKRTFPWQHAKAISEQDSTQKSLKVVKRTVEHGLAQASCQLGPDESRGVANSRKTSGESFPITNYYSKVSHLKNAAGNCHTTLTLDSSSSGNMRSDGHGQVPAFCQVGQDESHGATIPSSNSGLAEGQDKISVSNSVFSSLHLDKSSMTNDDTLSSGFMRTAGLGLAPDSCQVGQEEYHGVAIPVMNSGAFSSSSLSFMSNSQYSDFLGRQTNDTDGLNNIMKIRNDAWCSYVNLITTPTVSYEDKRSAAKTMLLSSHSALSYIGSLAKAIVVALLRHKVSAHSSYPSVVDAVIKQISGDSRDTLNEYLQDELKLNTRVYQLLHDARRNRQKNERINREGHILTVALRHHLDKIDELLTQEQEMYTASNTSIDKTLHHLIPQLRSRILDMPQVTRRCVDSIMEELGSLSGSMQTELCLDTGTDLHEYADMIIGHMREEDPTFFREDLRDSLTSIGLGKRAATISDLILEDDNFRRQIDKLLRDEQLLQAAAVRVLPSITVEVLTRALDGIGMRRSSAILGQKMVAMFDTERIVALLRNDDRLRTTATHMDKTTLLNSTAAQRRLTCSNLLEFTPAEEDGPTATCNYFSKLFPMKVGDIIHRPSTTSTLIGQYEGYPSLSDHDIVPAVIVWETKQHIPTVKTSTLYISISGQPLTYSEYMDPYARADNTSKRSRQSKHYTQSLLEMREKAHVRPIADRFSPSNKFNTGVTRKRRKSTSPEPPPLPPETQFSRAHAPHTGVQSFRPIPVCLMPRLAHPSYYAPLWVEEWQGRDDPLDVLHFMPRNNFVCVHKKPKLHKVIDDGWEDFLRENFPASSSSVQTKGQYASVKQRRHIKPRQEKRPHLLINCLQEKHGRQIKSKGMTKQQRKTLAFETTKHPQAQWNLKRGTSDNYNKTYLAEDNKPYANVRNISTTMLLSVQSTTSIYATPLQHESEQDHGHHSIQHSATLDESPEDGVSLTMCPTTSTDNTAKETRDDLTATASTDLGESLQIQPCDDSRAQSRAQLTADHISLLPFPRETTNMGIKTARGMTECQQRVIAVERAKYPPPIKIEDHLNREHGSSKRLPWALTNSNKASTRVPSRPSRLRNSAEGSAALLPAGSTVSTINTIDKIPSAGSSPTTELMPCSPLTTDQQFAQILSLCQTSMTDTRGLCTTLHNDRDIQAQINMDLRNSLAKAHAAIDTLTSMLRKCSPEVTTPSTLRRPITLGSSDNPTSGTSSITSSQIEIPGHENELAHGIASSDSDFVQISTLCQTSITETRGILAELSNNRNTQARINTDLRNSLARAHAAIDALTYTLHKL